MDSPGDIMRLCRLCLVKDQVNVPIFEDKGDIKKIFLKISSCLPVKVSRDDKLPKKICDGCSNKLDMLYEFWTTAANAEKTLLSWLGQAGVKDNDADETMSAVAQQIQKPAEPYVKQETLDPEAATNASEVGDHFLLQNFMQKFSYNESASTGPSATVTSNAETDEPPPKRARRTAAVKAQINISAESEEDDDNDAMEAMTKVEDESDESDGEDREPTYVDVPGTSGADDDQPGPSGVGKDGVEAPNKLKIDNENIVTRKSPRKRTNPDRTNVIASEESDTTSEDEKSPKEKRKYNYYRTWTCKKCQETFQTEKLLKQHRKIHKKDCTEPHTFKYDELQELYICTTCSAEFQEKHEAEKHILTHAEFFQCRTCKRQFSRAYHLGIHLADHDTDNQITCPFCPFKTNTRQGFLSHLNHVHLKKFSFNCETCGKGFNNKNYFREHQNVHLGVRPFNCIVCAKTFAQSRHLLGHQIRTHRVWIEGEPRPNQCSYCYRSFVQSSALEKHIEAAHVKNPVPNEKKHLCDTCGQGFTKKSKLVVHLRIHTGLKPFTCKECGKSFNTRDYLNVHERVHSGERPYSCEYCGKRFRQSAPFRVHLRTHTGERPYVCQFCGKGFTTGQGLKLHCKNCRR